MSWSNFFHDKCMQSYILYHHEYLYEKAQNSKGLGMSECGKERGDE